MAGRGKAKTKCLASTGHEQKQKVSRASKGGTNDEAVGNKAGQFAAEVGAVLFSMGGADSQIYEKRCRIRPFPYLTFYPVQFFLPLRTQRALRLIAASQCAPYPRGSFTLVQIGRNPLPIIDDTCQSV
jgi:hypothetical protein